jgi:hypothetical protein
MNFLPLSLFSVACLLAAPALLQGGEAPPDRPAATPPRIPAVEEIVGTWRLTRFESQTMKRDKRHETGYLLINDEFLSFECHIGWLKDSGARDASTFFSGTHRYRLRSDGVLELTQLIGCTVDPNSSNPVFEPPGRKREYRLSFSAASLILAREKDPQSFTFEKMPSTGPGLDFYGRRRQPEDGEK